MNEQAVILFFLVIGIGVTLFLYFWKAKKEIEYRKDGADRIAVFQYADNLKLKPGLYLWYPGL